MKGQNCNLFCFSECEERYNTLIFKRHEVIEKLSLKRKPPYQRLNPQVYPIFSKNNSSYELQRLKCSTDRSTFPLRRQAPYESTLFNRKLQIEHQLHQMNQQISFLNEKYISKMRKLKKIKQELGRALHQ